MRILFTLPDLHFGGSGNLLLQNINNLSKDHDIFIVYFGKNEKMLPNFQKKNCRISRINYSGKNDLLSAVSTLRAYIKKNEISIIHTNLFLDKMLVVLATIGLDVNKVATIHSAAIPDQNSNLKGYIQNKIMNYFLRNNFDKIVVVSNAAKKIHKDYRRLNEKDIEVIINGIEPLQKESVKNLVFDQDKVVLGTACRFDKVKGLERLIRIFSKIIELNSDVRLLLIGDGRKRVEIEKLIDEFKIKDYVFITGFSDSVQDYLNQLDYYVNSSYSEAMPISVIEALSLGLPVIASDVGGLPELVKTGDNGILIDYDNEAAAAFKISEFLDSNDKESVYAEYSRNAQLSFDQKFSSEVYVKRLVDLYKSL